VLVTPKMDRISSFGAFNIGFAIKSSKDVRFRIKFFEQRENMLQISKVTCYISPKLAYKARA
jgi:hypothetical protein